MLSFINSSAIFYAIFIPDFVVISKYSRHFSFHPVISNGRKTGEILKFPDVMDLRFLTCVRGKRLKGDSE
jgi:hypothetical protein